MGPVEQALRAELGRLGVPVAESTLAQTALDLAGRLDAGPGDRSVVQLSRELRLVLTELHQRYGSGLGGELSAFLASVSNPALRGPGD